jgi:hypothetical protein
LLGAIGIFLTIAIALLGAIWSELRSMRSAIAEMQTEHSTRLAVLETILSGLACRNGRTCNGDL